MRAKIITIAVATILAASGAAIAQTPAGGGSAEGNMNNPGSVKSNSEKSMERSTGSATGSTMDRPGMAPAAPGAGVGTGGPAGTGTPPGTGGTAGGPGGVNR